MKLNIASFCWVMPFLLIGMLGGCIAHAPPLLRGTQIVLPSKETTGLNPGQAADVVLKEAARITLDHGYRYFAILRVGSVTQQAPAFTVTPGMPVRVQLLKTNRNGAEHVWDAYSILRDHSLAR
jgi:hypothetical protein